MDVHVEVHAQGTNGVLVTHAFLHPGERLRNSCLASNNRVSLASPPLRAEHTTVSIHSLFTDFINFTFQLMFNDKSFDPLTLLQERGYVLFVGTKIPTMD